jgi:hypothetical protein
VEITRGEEAIFEISAEGVPQMQGTRTLTHRRSPRKKSPGRMGS